MPSLPCEAPVVDLFKSDLPDFCVPGLLSCCAPLEDEPDFRDSDLSSDCEPDCPLGEAPVVVLFISEPPDFWAALVLSCFPLSCLPPWARGESSAPLFDALSFICNDWPVVWRCSDGLDWPALGACCSVPCAPAPPWCRSGDPCAFAIAGPASKAAAATDAIKSFLMGRLLSFGYSPRAPRGAVIPTNDGQQVEFPAELAVA